LYSDKRTLITFGGYRRPIYNADVSPAAEMPVMVMMTFSRPQHIPSKHSRH
jgi:hypothetical protein